MLSFFPGSTRSPQFMNDEMQNHTVRVGSEATFSCTVEHLNTYKVAWLHSEKGTLAVYPTVISHNNRISVRHDNRHAYYLHLRDIQESDAGKYICQLNTDPAISVRGSLNVVGKTFFFILTCMICDGQTHFTITFSQDEFYKLKKTVARRFHAFMRKI